MRKSWVTGAVFAALISGTSVFAADWAAGTGSFFNDANWANPAFSPGLGEDGDISNGGNAQVDDDLATEMQDLFVGRGAGKTGTLTVVDGGFLKTRAPRFGVDGGTGNLVQTGGRLESTQDIEIGSTSLGNATVTGGELVAGGGNSLMVGKFPTGVGVLTLNSPDAVIDAADDIQFGREGNGTFNFQAGTIKGGYTVVAKFGTAVWNQSGGVFQQKFGDLEIGDGGRDDQAGTAGPRKGTINLSGGVMQTQDSVSIGNRRGSADVNVSGTGMIASTGVSGSNIFVGRGQDTTPGAGGPVSLKITGGNAVVVANQDFIMNLDAKHSSAALIEEITGPTHTTIRVGGNADLALGSLKVLLNGYAPNSGDSYTLISAGADLAADLEKVDNYVINNGYGVLTHAAQRTGGVVLSEFGDVDFTGAPLRNGLSWKLNYTDTDVILSVTGQLTGSPCDLNGDGGVDAADAGIMFGDWGGPGSTSPADKNDDGFVDAADAGAMFADWTGDPIAPGAKAATAEYNAETGELKISSAGAVNVFVQSASNAITPVNPAPAVPVGLLTNNTGRVGITNLGPIEVTNFSFGNIGKGLAMSDLKLVYTTALGTKGIEVPASASDTAAFKYIPEPASFGLIGLGLAGLLAARRRS